MTGLGIAVIGLALWLIGSVLSNATEQFAREFGSPVTGWRLAAAVVLSLGFFSIPIGLIWWALEALVL